MNILEKMYDRLFDAVKQSSSLAVIDQYADVLNDDYAKELLLLYELYLERMAQYSGDRRKYQGLVNYLRNLRKKVTGGDALADRLVDKWKIEYRNRRAMLDELRRI